MTDVTSTAVTNAMKASRSEPHKFALYFAKQVIDLAIKSSSPKLPSKADSVESWKSTKYKEKLSDPPDPAKLTKYKGLCYGEGGKLVFEFTRAKPKGKLKRWLSRLLEACTKKKVPVVIFGGEESDDDQAPSKSSNNNSQSDKSDRKHEISTGESISLELPNETELRQVGEATRIKLEFLLTDLEKQSSKKSAKASETRNYVEDFIWLIKRGPSLLSDELQDTAEDQQRILTEVLDVQEYHRILRLKEFTDLSVLNDALEFALQEDLEGTLQVIADSERFGSKLDDLVINNSKCLDWVKKQAADPDGWRPDAQSLLQDLNSGQALRVFDICYPEGTAGRSKQVNRFLNALPDRWPFDPNLALEICKLANLDRDTQHKLLSSAFREKQFDVVVQLMDLGCDHNAFSDQGTSTSGKARSLVGQVCEKLHQERETLTPLIKELQDRGADVLTWDKVEESQVVQDVVKFFADPNQQDKPRMFYGFEAMRSPFVEATKEQVKEKDNLLRMLDMWPVVSQVFDPSAYEKLQQGGPDEIAKHITSLKSKTQLSDKELKNVEQFLHFVVQPDRKYRENLDKNEREYLRETDILGTRLCKLGLDWVWQQGGTIFSLLDDIDEDDLLNYRDLKKIKAKELKEKHRVSKPAPSELGSKVITYSEVRHMLRNYQTVSETGGEVRFYRLGKELKPDEVDGLRRDFERVNLQSVGENETKTQIPKILERSSHLFGLDREQAQTILERKISAEMLQKLMNTSLVAQELSERLKSDPHGSLAETRREKIQKAIQRINTILSQPDWNGIREEISGALLSKFAE